RTLPLHDALPIFSVPLIAEATCVRNSSNAVRGDNYIQPRHYVDSNNFSTRRYAGGWRRSFRAPFGTAAQRAQLRRGERSDRSSERENQGIEQRCSSGGSAGSALRNAIADRQRTALAAGRRGSPRRAIGPGSRRRRCRHFVAGLQERLRAHDPKQSTEVPVRIRRCCRTLGVTVTAFRLVERILLERIIDEIVELAASDLGAVAANDLVGSVPGADVTKIVSYRIDGLREQVVLVRIPY